MDNNQYNNQYDNQYNNQYDNQYNVIETPNVTPYIVLSIIEAICCSRIFGIIALVLAILASSDIKNGNESAANDKIKIAKILLIVGVALGVVGSIVVAVSGLFAGIANI